MSVTEMWSVLEEDPYRDGVASRMRNWDILYYLNGRYGSEVISVRIIINLLCKYLKDIHDVQVLNYGKSAFWGIMHSFVINNSNETNVYNIRYLSSTGEVEFLNENEERIIIFSFPFIA